jgi:hypothetical protein
VDISFEGGAISALDASNGYLYQAADLIQMDDADEWSAFSSQESSRDEQDHA